MSWIPLFRTDFYSKLTTQTKIKRGSCKPFTFIMFSHSTRRRKSQHIFYVWRARHTDFRSAHEATMENRKYAFPSSQQQRSLTLGTFLKNILLLLVERWISSGADGRKLAADKKRNLKSKAVEGRIILREGN